MSQEKEPNSFEAPAENGEEIDVVEEGDVKSEDTVVLEAPETPDEGEAVDPEFFKGVPEADLEEEDEE